jgi:hypothetical protein
MVWRWHVRSYTSIIVQIRHSSHRPAKSVTPPIGQPGTPPTTSQPPAQSQQRGRAQHMQRQRSRGLEARKAVRRVERGAREGCRVI